MAEILAPATYASPKTIIIEPQELAGLYRFGAIVANNELINNPLHTDAYVSDDGAEWRYLCGSADSGEVVEGKTNDHGFIIDANLINGKYIKISLSFSALLNVGYLMEPVK